MASGTDSNIILNAIENMATYSIGTKVVEKHNLKETGLSHIFWSESSGPKPIEHFHKNVRCDFDMFGMLVTVPDWHYGSFSNFEVPFYNHIGGKLIMEHPHRFKKHCRCSLNEES